MGLVSVFSKSTLLLSNLLLKVLTLAALVVSIFSLGEEFMGLVPLFSKSILFLSNSFLKVEPLLSLEELFSLGLKLLFIKGSLLSFFIV